MYTREASVVFVMAWIFAFGAQVILLLMLVSVELGAVKMHWKA
jgi:hypothetical protein